MKRPIGSFFSELVNHPLAKIYFKVFGWPFVGWRRGANLTFMLLDARPREKILDAGCGLGIQSLALAQNNVSVLAVDIDENQINMAKGWITQLGFSNVRFEVQDICKLPYEDNSFDKILCCEVIEHVPNDERAISELVRVLKVGGNLVLTTPTPARSQTWFFFKPVPEAVGHVREGYTPEELLELLESNGLLITDQFYRDRFFERFAFEIQSFLLQKAGGLDTLKKAYLQAPLSNILSLLPFLMAFPSLFVFSKLDSILRISIRKNCIVVKAKK